MNHSKNTEKVVFLLAESRYQNIKYDQILNEINEF